MLSISGVKPRLPPRNAAAKLVIHDGGRHKLLRMPVNHAGIRSHAGRHQGGDGGSHLARLFDA